MEFLSNLIKRPRSLVLNDTTSSSDGAADELAQATNKSELDVGIARLISNDSQQHEGSLLATSMTGSYSDKSAGKAEKERTRRARTTSDGGDNNGSAANSTPSPSLMNRSFSGSTTSSSATSTTIEEMLIQINDSLDQADLDDKDDLASPAQGSCVPRDTCSRILSPLNAAKSIASGDGGRRFPTSNALTPTSAIESSPTERQTAFGVNGAMNTNPKELELLDDAHCSGVNKASNRFVGLTEFDEANIPELPACLNPDIEGQVKLNFDEDFITTLKPSANTAHKSTTKRADLEQFNLLLGDEPTDTALSSDNETFADCQSYRDINATNNPDNEMFAELDTYRSALNFHDGTTPSSPRGQHFMDTTMENIDELAADKAPVYFDLNEAALSKPAAVVMQQQLMLENVTYEDEPMDVDMSSTMDFECGANEAPGAPIEQLKESDSVPTQGVDQSGSSVPLCETQREYSPLEAQPNRSVELPPNPSVNFLSAECGIQDNRVDSASDTDNLSVATAVDVLLPTNDFPSETAPLVLSTGGVTDTVQIISSDAAQAAAEVIPIVDMKLNFMLDMMCSVSSAKSSPPSSPGFPVKPAADTVHFPRSPTSCVENKMIFLEKSEYSERMSAVEGAETPTDIHIIPPTPPKITETHAANLNETVDISEEQHEHRVSPVIGKESSALNGTFVSSRTDEATAADTSANSRTFIGISSPVQTVASNVDGQKEAASNYKLSSGENGRICDIESLGATLCIENTKEENFNVSSGSTRRTFNVLDEATPSVEDTKEENSLNFNVSSGSTRRTFNVLDEATQSAPLPNDSPEAMKLDTSMTLATHATASPPSISTLAERKVEAVASSSSLALSPSIPTIQERPVEQSLPLPALQKRQMSQSPPIPTIQKRQLGQAIEKSAPISTMKRHPDASAPRERTPLISAVLKRPSIHSAAGPFTSCATSPVELLSAKEQTQSNAMDEKDIFVDKFVTTPLDDKFAMPAVSSDCGVNAAPDKSAQDDFTDADFQSGTNFILNPSDFDFLLAQGNSGAQVNRSSLLLRFDPLVGVPVPIYQPQQKQQSLQQLLGLNSDALISTIEEEEHQLQQLVENQQVEQQHLQQLEAALPKKHARMSVDVIKDLNIDNDCNKAFENSNSQTDENKGNFQMDELEKKIKNEVLKTEDIEKKLKDAEQREEAMIKRITEKDKTISKMNGVIESYEKTIAELVREKEQLIQNYEMQLAEVKTDRDSNYHHLTSLETTFSDLHVKYEKSKEMTSQLKTSEEALLTEKRQILENLRLQEQRYEKMKNHAMQQLEIANRKLESQTKEHAIESTKLKALLKKEEISRASINEQLQQKSRENAELVKICDELINGQGS